MSDDLRLNAPGELAAHLAAHLADSGEVAVGIYGEIADERERQIESGWTLAYDESHNAHEWCVILMMQLGKAAAAADYTLTAQNEGRQYSAKAGRRKFRSKLIQVAAVCVAAIEAGDRYEQTAQEGGPA